MGEVASAFVTLVPSAKGFGTKIGQQIGGDVDTAGKTAGKRFGGSMSAGLAGVGGKVFAPLAAAAAGVGVASFFKDAVSGASDLSESASKVGVVFGKQASQILTASQTSAKAMGLSKQAYLDATGTLGNLLVSLDIAPQKSAAMSQQMVKLAGDLASFNNVSPEEALDALKSGLTGETEPLKRFGVNMNDATLKAQALKMGLIKSTKDALNPQNKALAAQALIMAQTKTAQGDFARTSGGLANQQRILAAQFTDVKATIGQALLPVVTRLVTFVNSSLLPGFSKVGGVVGKVKDAFTYLFTDGADGAQSFAEIVDNIFGNSGRLVGPLRTVIQVVKDVILGFRAMFLAFQNGDVTSNGIVGAFERIGVYAKTVVVPAVMGIVSSIRGFVAVALPIVQAFVAGMMARIGPLMPQVRAIFSTIGSIITGVMGLIQAVISRATAIIGGIWSRWGNQIMNFAAAIFRSIVTIIGGALKVISGVIKLFTAIFKGDWSGAWSAIKQIVSGAWQAIKGIVSGALTVLKAILSVAWAGIKAGASAAWSGIKSAVSAGANGVVSFISGLPGRFVSALGSLGSLLRSAGASLIQGLIDGIMGKIQDVINAASRVAKAIKDHFPGSPVKTGPLTSWNNGGAGKRLGGMLADGLTQSRRQVAMASAGLAGSVAIPSAASASGSSGGGPAVFHLLDADGTLITTMRGVAADHLSGTMTDARWKR